MNNQTTPFDRGQDEASIFQSSGHLEALARLQLTMNFLKRKKQYSSVSAMNVRRGIILGP
ncbi:MAG: hypothetical protein ACOY35_03040 [Bacillota bacterium]